MTTGTRNLPTQDEVLNYFKTCSNWGRWGADDERGTLNLITPEKIKRAAGLIREGVSVSCERPITYELGVPGSSLTMHYMTGTGEAQIPGAKNVTGGSGDFFGIAPHGYTITHMDAHSHMFWEGYMYNGKPATLVTARGAGAGSIEVPAERGVVGRGVLLDIARLKGVKWLENGTPVLPEDLEAAERAQNVRVEEGDILFVRTGHYRHRVEEGAEAVPPGSRPGIHASVMPWLHERGVAVIGGEGPEVTPSGYDLLRLPVHYVGIVAMGLYLIDAANFDDLAKACEERNRWEYFMTIAPLKFTLGTGCPVNPIAVF